MDLFSGTVLIVENNDALALTYSGWLEDAGFNVLHVYSGEKANETIKDNSLSIDLILIDTDFATCCSEAKDIPLIFLYSDENEEVFEKTEEIISNGYIPKNSPKNAFVAAVRSALRLYSRNKDLIKDAKESEERMRMIIEGTPNLFFYTQDTYANVTYISPSVETITGYSASEWMNQNHWFVTDSEINRNAKERTYAHLRGEFVSETICLEITHADSSNILLEVFENPIIKDGKVIGLLGIAQNITERKRIQDDLIRAKKEAEKSDKLKSEFLAQMSHEIRSPINTMLNFISLIKEEVLKPLSEEMVFSFNAIDSSSRRLIRTIDLILNMSQIQTGYLECSYQRLNLEEDVLHSILHEYSSSAELKGLDLNIYNEYGPAIIYADSYTVIQIFSNLINNAIKYTHTGKIDVRIYSDQEDFINVDISDTGIGISNEYISHIFTPFSQEEQGYTRKFEGNGLGLALVKKYCELNNAQISVRSKKGKGSTFTITFSLPDFCRF